MKNRFERLNWREYVKTDSRVFVKPNFTLPFFKPGVTTNEVVVESVLGVLKDRASEVFIGESDGSNRSFTAEYSLRNHGIPDICKRTGATMINLSTTNRKRIEAKINGKQVDITLPSDLCDIDLSLSIPVLKVHAMTQVSLSLKNLWGCHPDTMRLLEHTHLSEKLVLIAKSIRLKFAVIDAIYGLDTSGPMNGDAIKIGAIIIGDNPVATDATCSRMIGFSPERIPHIAMASRLGLGPTVKENIEILDDLSAFQQQFHLRQSPVDRLSAMTFKNGLLAKLVFDSPLTRPAYRMIGRNPRRRISRPGDEI